MTMHFRVTGERMRVGPLLKRSGTLILFAFISSAIGCGWINQRRALQELPEWHQVNVFGHGRLKEIVYAPQGHKVAVCTTKSIEIRDATTWTMEREFLGGVGTAAWSPDASQLVSGA